MILHGAPQTYGHHIWSREAVPDKVLQYRMVYLGGWHLSRNSIRPGIWWGKP